MKRFILRWSFVRYVFRRAIILHIINKSFHFLSLVSFYLYGLFTGFCQISAPYFYVLYGLCFSCVVEGEEIEQEEVSISMSLGTA